MMNDNGPFGELLLNQLICLYGPNGSNIILNKGDGSIEITRDGHYIINLCRNNNMPWNSISKILLLLCINVGKIYGDGTITTSLILNSLIKNFIHINNIKRIKYLQAFEILHNVFNLYKVNITEFHINNGIWKSSSLIQNYNISSSSSSEFNEIVIIRGLLLNILYPATNNKLANILIDLIILWLKINNDGNSITKCKYAINNFEDLIVYSETASSSGQLIDSYILPIDSLMIETARCKDLSKLQYYSNSINKKYLFICIQSLFAKSNDDKQLIVSITSLSSLTKSSSYRLLYVEELISYMKINDITVLLTSDEVDDDIYYKFVIADIVIIDRFPTGFLQRIANLSKTIVWTNILDFQRYVYDDDNNNDKNINKYGCFSKIKFVKTGFSTSYLLIKGISSIKDINISSICISQLVLVCNAVSLGLYRRLIRRCLKYIINSFEKNNFSSDIIAITPGAGAAEMKWSILFQNIAFSLISDEINENDIDRLLIDFIVSKLKFHTEEKYNKSLLNEISNICHLISIAYKEIPKSLINNSNRNKYKQSHLHYTEKILNDWSNSINDKTSMVLLGYIVNNDNDILKTGLLCSLQSSFNPDNLVISSSTLFWYIFTTIMEGMKLYLRTGGTYVTIKKSKNKE